MKKNKSDPSTFRAYYLLTKPGIVRGNLITVAAGFLLASTNSVDRSAFFAVLLGSALCIGSGCVFNNYIDRGIDKKMERTRNRAIVSGRVSGRAAIIYACILGISGLSILAIWTNLLTVAIGASGIFFYVVVYGYAKRKSVWGTVVGSISGAIPPLAGYTAASGRIDGGAILIFLILVLWQMPHFYAIAIFRKKEYAAAGIPVLPVVKGIRHTKIQMMAYIAAFTVAAVMLSVFGYASYAYGAVAFLLGAYWFRHGMRNFRSPENVKWAKRMFGVSLIVILLLSATIYVDSLASIEMI